MIYALAGPASSSNAAAVGSPNGSFTVSSAFLRLHSQRQRLGKVAIFSKTRRDGNLIEEC